MKKKPGKIKLLIVDDSFFMRKLLSRILEDDPRVEIVGEASNGLEAISQVRKLKPDVVTMDYEMPEMDGAWATEKILQGSGELPAIIMVSAYTKAGDEKTLEALRAGAVDFIAKPSGELSLDIEDIQDELLRKIKVAATAEIKSYKKPKRVEKNKVPPVDHATKLVLIGASTGGPPVLEQVISGLPNDLGAGVLIVQHMPKHFIQTFSERLDTITPLHVGLAEDGMVIKNNQILFAPGEIHTKVVRKEKTPEAKKYIEFSDDEPMSGFKPSIDKAMMAAAHCYANRMVGVILTGMGRDGLEGIRAVKTVRGFSIAQSPETSVVDSMPKAVIDEGLADEILPPDQIAEKIVTFIREIND